MAKIKDETIAAWLIDKLSMSQAEAWNAVLNMQEKDKAEDGEKAPRQKTEWLVVTADPDGTLRKDLVGFVVNKKPIMLDEKYNPSTEPRMWGDEEAQAILDRAFDDTRDEVKGIPTFLNCLRAAKKKLKSEYGFEIKTKEGCWIAPIDHTVDPDWGEDDDTTF